MNGHYGVPTIKDPCFSVGFGFCVKDEGNDGSDYFMFGEFLLSVVRGVTRKMFAGIGVISLRMCRPMSLSGLVDLTCVLLPIKTVPHRN